MINRTIAAIATPLGPGGIGIIRISGPEANAILKALFVKQKRQPNRGSKEASEEPFYSHHVYYGHIVHPKSGAHIDEVLVIYMRAPKSFTREDVVEIHSHSGYVVLDRILSSVIDAGADLAGPGEFSKRAFLNGRIDLTQAEAIIDLINAPCETAVQMASEHIAGGFRDVVNNLIVSLRSLQARCEAIIEFGETDELPQESSVETIQDVIRQTLLPEISALITRAKEATIYREGVLLAIAGIPNVGKSSLLNRLVDKETAIVSEIPGTTRDIVRDYVSIKGVPVIVCDTAGIHDSEDPVECIGISKAREQIQRANLVLLVVEATRTMDHFEKKLLADCDPHKTIVVFNKVDILEDGSKLERGDRPARFRHISVSAKRGDGIRELKQLIFHMVTSGNAPSEDGTITPNIRHRKILEKAKQEIMRIGNEGSGNGLSFDLISDMLQTAISTLEEISGKRDCEDLYEHIFSQFCIGK